MRLAALDFFQDRIGHRFVAAAKNNIERDDLRAQLEGLADNVGGALVFQLQRRRLPQIDLRNIDVNNAGIGRRSHSAFVTPAQDLAEPPHLETFERISRHEGPERRRAADGEEERPGRPKPDLFSGNFGPGRTARRHFFSELSLESTSTPGRSAEKLTFWANCRQGNAAPRNTPPTSGSLTGA